MAKSLTSMIDNVLNNRHYQYWILQTAGWIGYTFFILVTAWLYDKIDIIYVLHTSGAAITGLLLSEIMRKYYQLSWDKPPLTRSMQILAVLLVATALWSGWKLYIHCILEEIYIENLLAEYFYWYSFSLFILLSWTGLYYGIKYYKIVQEERQKTLKLSAMAHQAQLKMLRYQLNPHFLYNTLNSISTLIMDEDKKTANHMISELSKFLRYSLDNDPMQKVNLEKEIEAMNLYLGIEKIRFEERLHLDVDIQKPALKALIPSMLLQPLIENAIKYVISKNTAGGTIHIKAQIFADELLMEVYDDGPGMDLENYSLTGNHGVGIDNIRERLDVLYGDKHSFKLSNIQPHGLKISIRIPYQTEESDSAWKN